MVSYLHDGPVMSKDSCTVGATVRHKLCELLVTSSTADACVQCNVCKKYMNVLRPIYHNYVKQSSQHINPKTNLRYLNTPQSSRKHVQSLRRDLRNEKRKTKLLKKKLEKVTNENGIELDESLNGDIATVIDRHRKEIETLSKNDFQRVFWEQQVYHNKCCTCSFRLVCMSGSQLCIIKSASTSYRTLRFGQWCLV